MAELKRNFSKATMNKDMDERLVPDGQYRDALNIQISTSDGSDVGAAQTLLGNAKHSDMVASSGVYAVPDTATCVATVAAENKDKIYYFVSGGDKNNASTYVDIRRDYILEYDTVTQKHKYVFVDIHKVLVAQTVAVANTPQPFVRISGSGTTNDTGVRIGMVVKGVLGPSGSGIAYEISDGLKVTDLKYDSGSWQVHLENSDGTVFSSTTIVTELSFHAPRVLNFSKNNIITGINVLDDFIYWTDNITEPKKISISRSIAGTGGTEYLNGGGVGGFADINTVFADVIFTGDTHEFHTRLVKDKHEYTNEANRHEIVRNAAGNKAVWAEESHITVIKKAPTQPLDIELFRGHSSRIKVNGTENSLYSYANIDVTDGDDLVIVGTEITGVTFGNEVDYRVGDIVLFARQDEADLSTDFENYHLRARVTASNVTNPDELSSTGFSLLVLSVSSSLLELPSDSVAFYSRLETGQSLFTNKFPRFSYRYRYQDGEYSSFAPWSRIAFLPDFYDFQPKKGYNLGMANQVKSIKLKQYHASENSMPQDVVSIDLLYKETNNPTVYTVKTVKRSDGFDDGVWPDMVSNTAARGEFTLDTDMIYAVVPSNQLLRPWDNVPRRALAQEVSANRLIYGNYLHGYTVLKDPVLNVSVHADGLYYAGQNTTSSGYAMPSVKTLRDYQLGVVFSDGYGRETPVLTSKKASTTVPKDISKRRNRLNVSMDASTIVPDWARYFSYYVKETSDTYHTLSMDRWYPAHVDGNIWLSFPSSERNKVDIDTFLILKKAHGSDTVVTDKARYKVLAIESEAPEIIKTKKKSLGRLFAGDHDSGVVGDSSGSGFPLQDHTEITISESEFFNAFGVDLHIKTPDTLMLRLYSQDNMSKDYEVSRVSFFSGVGYTLKIATKFGPDAAFVSTDDTFANAVDDLVVELIEYEPTNSPEFDGRFFVKIHKDDTLSQHVLLPTVNQEYVVDRSWPLRYINNNGWETAGDMTSGTSNISHDMRHHDEDSSVTGRSIHPTSHEHHADYWWGGGSDSSATNQVWGITTADIDSHAGNHGPVKSINEHNQGRKYWEGVANTNAFFVDACTAYSWSGREKHRAGNLWWTNYDVIQADGSGGDGEGQDESDQFWSTGGEAAEHSEGAPDGFTGNMSNGGNHEDGIVKWRSMPSRGIWNYGKFMDISWSGMGEGYTNSGWGDATNNGAFYPHRLDQMPSPSTHSEASDFITALNTIGTKFRFQRDPDSTVYTVNNEFAQHWWGYNNPEQLFWEPNIGTNAQTGAWGIRNYRTVSPHGSKKQYEGDNLRQRWTVSVEPNIGSGPSGYNPITGTTDGDYTQVTALSHDGWNNYGGSAEDVIEIIVPFFGVVEGSDSFSHNPAIWETEPKDVPDLDIYYQATGLTPLELNEKTNEEYIPIGSTFRLTATGGDASAPTFFTVTGWSGAQTLTFTPAIPSGYNTISDNQSITFTKRDSYTVRAVARGAVGDGDTTIKLWGGSDTIPASKRLYSQLHTLDWSNCWSFGNGVESDTIRDSFNANRLDNGVKASTVLAEQSREERRKNGLIWSGIYNSSAGVNETNQFIAAEKITKDVNPSHGSIQRLLNRDTRLIMFCEDKVLRGVTNKDALYNADGDPQLVSSNSVIGDVTAYQGDFGISKNPESMVVTPYSVYFTDAIRGQVLALSSEGVRSISDLGMKNYFANLNATYVWHSLGTYDERKNEYNLTISKKYAHYQVVPHEQTTISYSEMAKGWVSFKSFTPQHGISLNNNYYTFHNGHIWKHHVEKDQAGVSVDRNKFYGVSNSSDVTLIFNDAIDSVKSFGSINYEGTQAKITNFDTEDAPEWLSGISASADGVLAQTTVTDGEYYNIEATVNGWHTASITTNLQTAGSIEFKEKEGKWFGLISGEATSLSNLDKEEFTVQGLGVATFDFGDEIMGGVVTNTVANNLSTSYVGVDGSGATWDVTAD